ncbi:MAG: NUDIX domain-containing protein [Candidatus Babeliales bacterium]|jgi:ADP-ribose pyrophosphatase YjhB (NUDIX family)
MARERFKIGAFVALILRKNEKILLIRRFNTGSGDGFYACAGGGVDGDEPITQAMIREADEELGIKLKKENLKIVHVIHSKQRDGANESVGFFMEATVWEGEPQNMEPHKHDDVAWFALYDLPQNTFPRLIHVIKMMEEKIFYSEYGWD